MSSNNKLGPKGPSLCPDCGCPVTESEAGTPKMTVAFDADGYHDNSACIRWLRDETKKLFDYQKTVIREFKIHNNLWQCYSAAINGRDALLYHRIMSGIDYRTFFDEKPWEADFDKFEKAIALAYHQGREL